MNTGAIIVIMSKDGSYKRQWDCPQFTPELEAELVCAGYRLAHDRRVPDPVVIVKRRAVA